LLVLRLLLSRRARARPPARPGPAPLRPAGRGRAARALLSVRARRRARTAVGEHPAGGAGRADALGRRRHRDDRSPPRAARARALAATAPRGLRAGVLEPPVPRGRRPGLAG